MPGGHGYRSKKVTRLSSSLDPSLQLEIPNGSISHPTRVGVSAHPVFHDGSSPPSNIPDGSSTQFDVLDESSPHLTAADGRSPPLSSHTNDHTSSEHEESVPVQPILNTHPMDTRPYIEVHDNTFHPLNTTYATLKHIIHSHYDGVYICFSEVPDNTVDLWWKGFQKEFQWDKTRFYDEVVYKAFKHKASNHIKTIMSKTRNSLVRQPWMSEDLWKGCQKRWKEDPKFLHRSAVNKRNRAVATEKGIPVYTGGSISTSAHKQLLKDELKREPTPKETFEKCYTKKDGTWSGKAGETAETFDTLLDEETQLAAISEGPHPIDMNRIWIKAAGGVKKGRIFGMGSEARSVLKLTQHATHSTPLPTLQEKEETRTSVQEVREEVTELSKEMRTSVETVRTEVTQNNQRWQTMFEQLIKGQNDLNNIIGNLAKKPRTRGA